MHYYPFNLKDYLTETAHLPPMADLAYRRLLDLYYKTEAPIPNKPKWVANRIRLDSEEKVIGFVLREYFTIDGAGDASVWRHHTCDQVIEKYQKKVARARENGQQHKAGTHRKPKSDADGKLTNNHKPRTNLSPQAPEGAEAEFESFWSKYPRKVGKPPALRAYIKALKRATAPQILAGLMKHIGCEQWTKDKGHFIPHASTWLNRDGWDDESQLPEDAAAEWHETRGGVEKRAQELGMPKWSELEPYPTYKGRVMAKAGAVVH